MTSQPCNAVERENSTLWEFALNALTEDEKKTLMSEDDNSTGPDVIIAAVEKKKSDCEKNQWVLYTNKAGKKVMVRDVLSRICDNVEKFKAIGDVAVQFDPVHAALPWMALTSVLKVAVSDCQTFGLMAESLETVSDIIERYTYLEAHILILKSTLTSQLSKALVKLYQAVLKYLGEAGSYYSKSTLRRALGSVVKSSKDVVEEPMLQIEKHEQDVNKLVTMVRDEGVGLKLGEILRHIKPSSKADNQSIEDRSKKLIAWINGIDAESTYENSVALPARKHL